MLGDTTTTLLGSSAIVAGLIYGAVSGFITGPTMIDRMTEKTIDWPKQCVRTITAEVRRNEAPAPQMPTLGCRSIFGWLGPDGDAYCRMHGHLFDDNPLNQAMTATQTAARQAQENRLRHAAERAPDRCACAVTTTIEENRLSIALYAGTWRLVQPPAIKNLKSELATNLNASACAMKGGRS
jgi:hypothetical protein